MPDQEEHRKTVRRVFEVQRDIRKRIEALDKEIFRLTMERDELQNALDEQAGPLTREGPEA